MLSNSGCLRWGAKLWIQIGMKPKLLPPFTLGNITHPFVNYKRPFFSHTWRRFPQVYLSVTLFHLQKSPSIGVAPLRRLFVTPVRRSLNRLASKHKEGHLDWDNIECLGHRHAHIRVYGYSFKNTFFIGIMSRKIHRGLNQIVPANGLCLPRTTRWLSPLKSTHLPILWSISVPRQSTSVYYACTLAKGRYAKPFDQYISINIL